MRRLDDCLSDAAAADGAADPDGAARARLTGPLSFLDVARAVRRGCGAIAIGYIPRGRAAHRLRRRLSMMGRCRCASPLSLSLSLPLPLSLSLLLSISISLCLSVSLSVCLSLSHTHTLSLSLTSGQSGRRVAHFADREGLALHLQVLN